MTMSISIGSEALLQRFSDRLLRFRPPELLHANLILIKRLTGRLGVINTVASPEYQRA